jgi:hypothetical protein
LLTSGAGLHSFSRVLVPTRHGNFLFAPQRARETRSCIRHRLVPNPGLYPCMPWRRLLIRRSDFAASPGHQVPRRTEHFPPERTRTARLRSWWGRTTARRDSDGRPAPAWWCPIRSRGGVADPASERRLPLPFPPAPRASRRRAGRDSERTWESRAHPHHHHHHHHHHHRRRSNQTDRLSFPRRGTRIGAVFFLLLDKRHVRSRSFVCSTPPSRSLRAGCGVVDGWNGTSLSSTCAHKRGQGTDRSRRIGMGWMLSC